MIWFHRKQPVSSPAPHLVISLADRPTGTLATAAPKAAATQVEENPFMGTTTATPAPAANGFIRFIDAIGNFFVHSAPEIEAAAAAAEPMLALTPFGPEYDLVVNAIIGVQKTATASLTTGATLSGAQKMALVVEAATPGLTSILASKGITSGVPAAITQWAQNVYNMQTGPTTTVAAAPVATPAAA